MFSILEHGAIAGGKILNTKAIQNTANVVLEDMHICGDFAQKKDRVEISGCQNIVTRNCSFTVDQK